MAQQLYQFCLLSIVAAFAVLCLFAKVHLVINRQSGKPRGYAFIEFDHERDMHG